MAKTNFTRAEEIFREGLEQMMKDRLLELAKEADNKTPEETKELKDRIYFVCAFNFELKRLYKSTPDLYKTLEINKEELDKLLNDPLHLSKEEWEKVLLIRTKIDSIQKSLPTSTDEQLLEQQRKQNINKRFNVNDKWLPLQ